MSYRPPTLFAAAAALVALTTWASPADAREQGPNRIQRIDAREEGETTFVTIRGSATPTFTVYKLERPERVVIDLANATLAGDSDPVDVNTWSVGQVSFMGLQNGEVELARVIIGVARPSSYRVAAVASNVVVTIAARERRPAAPPAGDEAPRLLEAAHARLEEASVARQAAEVARQEAERTRQEAEALKRGALEVQVRSERARKEAEAARDQAVAAAAVAMKRRTEAEAAEALAHKRRTEAQQTADEAAKRAAEAQVRKGRGAADADRRRSEAERAWAAAEARRKEVEQAATQAETRRRVAETRQKEADARRVAAESAEQEAEVRRFAADRARTEAEAKRQAAEAARKEAEARRIQMAQAAAQAETRRAAADAALAAALAERTAAEAARREADQVRGAALAEKEAAEVKRAEAEKARAEALALRAAMAKAEDQAEAKRSAAEAELRAAQAERAAAGAARKEVDAALAEKKEAEAGRSEAEKARAQAEAARDAALSEAERAEAARRAAEAGRMREEERAQTVAQTVARMRREEEERASAARASRLREEETVRREGEARLAAEKLRLEAVSKLAELERSRESAEAAAKTAESRRAEAEAAARRADEIARTQGATEETVREARGRAEELEGRHRAASAALEARRGELHTAEAQANKAALERDRLGEEVLQLQKEAALARSAAEREERRRQELTAEREAEEARLAEAKRQRLKEEQTLAKLQAPARPRRVEWVRDVDYEEQDGRSRVVLTLSGPAVPEVVSSSGQKQVIELSGVDLPQALERTLDTSEHLGPIRAVSAYRHGPHGGKTGKVRVVAELRPGAEDARSSLKRKARPDGGETWSWEFQKVSPPRALERTPAPVAETRRYEPPVVGGYGAASTPVTATTVAQSKRVYHGPPISLEYKDADIHNVLRALALFGGVSIVVPEDVEGAVTIRLDKIPWDQALDVILRSKSLGYRWEGKLIRVAKAATLAAEEEAERQRRRLLVQEEAPEPEIFTLNYAVADELSRQVTPLLSPQKGKIQVDKRTNTLIINDIKAVRGRIIELLTRLDTQTPQIQIEARVVEARSSFSREIGVQWGLGAIASAATGNPTGLVFPSSAGVFGGAGGAATAPGIVGTPDFAVNLPAAVGLGAGGAMGFTLGSIGGNFNLALRLSAAEESGSARIISAPRVTVLNNIEAVISQGVSIPISVVSAQGVQTQFVPADLRLTVTPHVAQRDCSVQLELEVTKNEADFSNRGARGDPTLVRKEVKTTAILADGDTTVIGGIYTSNKNFSRQKVPFLADIPLLGFFFRSQLETNERTEVLIFMTPKITNKASLRCEARTQ